MTLEKNIRDLQELNLDILSQLRDDCVAIFSNIENRSGVVNSTISKLFHYLSCRCQAVSLLVGYEYSWDAEIILRSFYETGVKILLICITPDADKETLMTEYWDISSINENRRTSRKASIAEKVFDENTVARKIFEHLQDEQAFPTDTNLSKSERKKIEKKWSFTEIVESIKRTKFDGIELSEISSLLHIYGVASHLAHCDHIALNLVEDRSLRPEGELKILEISHTSRILIDQVSIYYLCALAIHLNFAIEFKDKKQIEAKIRYLFEISN